MRLRLPPLKLAIRSSSRPDQAQKQYAVQDADHPQIEPHVAVEDVAELVGDDALQLVARELLDAAARDADHRVARREPGGERIDALFVFHHEHGRHRDARREGHLLDDVQEAAFVRLERIGINPPPAEPLGDARAAARKLSDLEQAAAGDQRERRNGCTARDVPREVAAGTETVRPALRRPDGHRRHDKCRRQDADHRQRKRPDQPLRIAAGRRLSLEKVGGHGKRSESREVTEVREPDKSRSQLTVLIAHPSGSLSSRLSDS